VFLAHGLTPKLVLAARSAGRTTVPVRPGVVVREFRETDLDAAVELKLEPAALNARFGARPPTASTEPQYRRVLEGRLASPEPWAWVAEVAGEVVGLIVAIPPSRTERFAQWVAASSIAYVACMVVAADHRGGGVGASLVQAVHEVADAAGIEITLLDYYALNPVSAPFWHRCGYRPLWTDWTRLADRT
jgi:GNAT superfamily N-acetyltransferase